MAKAKPHRDSIQREQQIRRDTDTNKDVSSGLINLDEAIIYYCDNVARLQIPDNNNVVQKVPVIYGSPERWKNVQKTNFYRDTKGKIQLPLIMYRRTNVTKNRDLGMKVDVNNPLHHYVENKYSIENRYDKFDILQGRKRVREYQKIVVPDQVIVTYECVVWTEYITQMNRIIEALSYSEGSYWGDENKYLVKAVIDEFTTATELVSGNDRAVKSDFTITLHGHLIPDTLQKQAQQGSSKTFSPSQVSFGEKVVDNLSE